MVQKPRNNKFALTPPPLPHKTSLSRVVFLPIGLGSKRRFSKSYTRGDPEATHRPATCPKADNPIKHPFTPIYQGQKQVSHF